MSYYFVRSEYKNFDWEDRFVGVREAVVGRAISRDHLDEREFFSLLSPSAEPHLEEMAEKARGITARYFGKTIQLYTPLYLSNYCDNRCLYCGFNAGNNMERRRLSPEELEKEAQFIASTGLRHILILTGESRRMSPVSYIVSCVRILKKYFSSISVEVYPLSEDEYAALISEDVDTLTIYQETYDEAVYSLMHPQGPKSDYRFRLDAPERGAKALMRSVNIGALFGLSAWRKEAYLMGLHAKYLQDKFPDVDISVSVPRIRPQTGSFKAPYVVSDKNITQIIFALRIFLPRLGIALSTRENPSFREHLIGLGITKMSAGSTTAVGGHTINPAGNSRQFEISDQRNVREIMEMLKRKGYQPVMKDWLAI